MGVCCCERQVLIMITSVLLAAVVFRVVGDHRRVCKSFVNSHSVWFYQCATQPSRHGPGIPASAFRTAIVSLRSVMTMNAHACFAKQTVPVSKSSIPRVPIKTTTSGIGVAVYRQTFQHSAVTARLRLMGVRLAYLARSHGAKRSLRGTRYFAGSYLGSYARSLTSTAFRSHAAEPCALRCFCRV